MTLKSHPQGQKPDAIWSTDVHTRVHSLFFQVKCAVYQFHTAYSSLQKNLKATYNKYDPPNEARIDVRDPIHKL